VGKDYLRAGGTLKIPALAPYAIIPVTTLGDLEVENDETFFVNLSAPTNVTIAQAQGIGLIQNDDVVRTLSVCDIQVAEGALGQLTDALFYFNLYPSCSVTVQVDFATSDGTAKAGLDYQAKFGTVVFPPGVTTRCVSVQVRGDNTAERDETFFLALTNAVNAVLATNRPAQCTITNDDGLFVPVDHFAWDPIGATQQMYRAFFTTLTAKDATNGTLTNYHSPVTLKVNGYNGAVVSNVLAGLAPSGSMNESVTLGYAFTPSTNLVVTHVRHFTGTKVSFWTSAGELLSNVAVEDMPGV
jgi:hypothetical protein